MKVFQAVFLLFKTIGMIKNLKQTKKMYISFQNITLKK
jgi:hypothetical protein